MQLPLQLLESLTGVKGFDKEAFVHTHESGEQVTSVRFNPAKLPISSSHPLVSTLPIHRQIPWTSHGYYLTHRPSFIFDPLIHAGVYYVQEASSMFVEQALRQTVDTGRPLRVLDLCAAPGGKSTLLQSLLLPDSLLVSNEVIKSRAGILEENMTKWGAPNVIVTNADPSVFARLGQFFDVIVVDAPCSGSGLFRREPEAIAEWSESNVQLCCQRQQRILADVLPALQPGGVLIYSTCSYSTPEDEEVADWLIDNFALQSLPLQPDASWGIVETQSDKHKAYGYRFFPDQVKGEGFFISCFRKEEGHATTVKPSKKPALPKAAKSETAVVQPWLQPGAMVQLWKQKDELLAFPVALEKELLAIAEHVYVKKAGVVVGKIAAGTELIPDHALAVSTIINKEIIAEELNKEQSVQFLRKEEVSLQTKQKGWTLMRYEQHNLGWVKVLPNRVNNYYPANWRILKRGGEES